MVIEVLVLRWTLANLEENLILIFKLRCFVKAKRNLTKVSALISKFARSTICVSQPAVYLILRKYNQLYLQSPNSLRRR